MQQPERLPLLVADVRRLRIYRLLANSYVPLLAVALALLVLRWIFPWLFSVLAIVWTADALLLILLAVPWLLVSWALASGKIRCPSCHAPFASKFHLWAPKACQNCRYDITAPMSVPTSSGH